MWWLIPTYHSFTVVTVCGRNCGYHSRLRDSLSVCSCKCLNSCSPVLLQGANASALEKEIGSEQFPVNEHYFGLVNVSKDIPCCLTWSSPTSVFIVMLWNQCVCSVCFVPQFGNTCYCNSVLQALYFCRPFREKILAYRSQPRRKENLLTCLADLFHSIANQKRKVGVIPPKKFITRLRKENGKEHEQEGIVFEFSVPLWI